MAIFRISPATSISFVIDTGSGKLNEGVQQSFEQRWHADGYFDGEHGGFAFFWNFCDNVDNYKVINPCQTFGCDDQPAFQIFHAANDATPWTAAQPSNPILGLLVEADNESTVLATLSVESLSDTPGVKFTVPDLTDICPDCARIALYTVSDGEGAVNEWPCADNGTFEADILGTTTGANNTLARQGLIKRTGSWAGQCTAGVTPAAGDELIIQCTSSFSFTQGDIIYIKGWVYQAATGIQFTNALNFVEWDTSDFTDASTLYELKGDPFATQDTWIEVSKIIKIGADLTGDIKLVSQGLPTASGIIYMDDLSVFIQATTRQAISQCLRFVENPCNTVLATYSSDQWAFGMVYGSDITFENTLRLGGASQKVYFSEFRFTDSKGENFRDSLGQASVQGNFVQMVRTLRISSVAPYMAEKIALALKSQNLTIHGTDYVAAQKDVEPTWVQGTPGVNVDLMEFELTPVNYDQKQDRCS